MPKGKKQPVEERFWEKVDKCENGCWEWRVYTSDGYGRIDNDGKNMLSHRLSYEIHHPLTQPIQDIKLFVMHSCDNPKCVNPAHLSLGTHQDNMADMKNKGRWNGGGAGTPGEKNPSAKLTEQQVIEIRTRYANGGITHTQIAKEYGVSRQTISYIISRHTWAYLQ